MDTSNASFYKRPKKGKKGKQNGKKDNKTVKGNCYNCGKPGHYSKECRQPRKDQSASNTEQQLVKHTTEKATQMAKRGAQTNLARYETVNMANSEEYFSAEDDQGYAEDSDVFQSDDDEYPGGSADDNAAWLLRHYDLPLSEVMSRLPAGVRMVVENEGETVPRNGEYRQYAVPNDEVTDLATALRRNSFAREAMREIRTINAGLREAIRAVEATLTTETVSEESGSTSPDDVSETPSCPTNFWYLCYDDQCEEHMGIKERLMWYPRRWCHHPIPGVADPTRELSGSYSSSRVDVWLSPVHVRQHWTECYIGSCMIHRDAKEESTYWPDPRRRDPEEAQAIPDPENA
jgi:hypothetical protein